MDGVTLPNHPTIPSPDVLRELLGDENRDLVKRAEELIEALARAPETIGDDETSGDVADFVKQIDAALKLIESRRTTAKQPALDAGKAIDGFFRPMGDKLTGARRTLANRIEKYLIAKAAAERKRREEDAARAEMERKAKEAAALKAMETASAGQAEAALEQAIDAQHNATQTAIFAEAKPAEMARTRGELGSVSTLATRWTFEITDLAKIPLDTLRPYLSQDAIEKAIRGYMATLPKPITVEMAGVKFFEKSSAVIA